MPDPTSFYNGTVWASLANTPSFELDGTSVAGGFDWSEVGSANTFSNQIQINRNLVVGDILTFRIDSGGGSTTGAAGPAGPSGPVGPPGAGPGGSAATPISTNNSNYTVTLGDTFLKANASSGSITFTLQSASSAIGRIFYFIKVDNTANAMTIAAAGADLINGLSSLSTFTQYDSFSIVSDGTTWSAF